MPDPLKRLLELIRRKPSNAPDGKTKDETTSKAIAPKTSVPHDLVRLDGQEVETVMQAIKTFTSGHPMNDKELLLENAVSMLQKLPPNSGLGHDVQGLFVKLLWDDLSHPPGTLAGPPSRYRRHDGGQNSERYPEMGKAGSAYCRNVPAQKPKGPNLPDVELVYENLLRRSGTFRPHPSGLNRLFFSFATIVIHELFQTNHTSRWINETSSYVDLSTLYGNTEKEQVRVRTKQNGLIFPDSIASNRIMLMPSGVITVLLMFSRNHNHIAESLLTINEAGEYREWGDLDDKQKEWQDNDIFQIARNINVGFFASIVLHDYVAAILNTPRANSEWYLDIGGEIKQGISRLERGSGNIISVEFAVLYHWHATLSDTDVRWMERLIRDNFPDLKSPDDMTIDLYHKLLRKQAEKLQLDKPEKARTWEFGGLKRGEDGQFSDADLGKIIKDCVEEPAHAFGAQSTPASMKIIDIMSQLKAREAFNVCTLNEFRKYLNLKPYDSFEEWNSNPGVARAAELLYAHIDNLELYPGLQAECTKPFRLGSGLCPGQTTGRGILDDAVALIRGDRFLTYDFNSSTLTNWGVSKLKGVAGGSCGAVLPKLLFQALPGEFTGTSPYVLLPFYTPEAAKEILHGNKVVSKYSLTRPPSAMGMVGIHTQEGCKRAFDDRENFHTMYQHAIRETTDGHDFMIGWDDQKRHDPRSEILHKVWFQEGFEKDLTRYFRSNVRELIQKSTLKYPDHRRSVDIVRDVCNITPIMWLAERFAIPIKTQQHPHGILTIQESFKAWLGLFIYQSFNVLPANEWDLREGTQEPGSLLRKVFAYHLKTQNGVLEGAVDELFKGSAYEVGPEADRFYKSMHETGLPIGDLVGDCMGMGAPVAGNLTQQASLLIDFFLQPAQTEYKNRIVELAHQEDNEAADRELLGFVFEGMRQAGVVPGLPRIAARDLTFNDGARGPIHIKANQLVLIATSKAAMDPAAFPDPEKLDPHRPFSAYTLLGRGLHYCFGARMVGAALAATLKEVFRLKNVRRANWPQGYFRVVVHKFADGVEQRMYLNADATETPIPTSLQIMYDV